MKKFLSLFLSTLMVFGSVGLILAAESKVKVPEKSEKATQEVKKPEMEPLFDSDWKRFMGGWWRHGVGETYVWSHYDHSKLTHKTSVQGSHWEIRKSKWKKPGKRASASYPKAYFGNKAWCNVK